MGFAEYLEDTTDEVSIYLYPIGQQYQIYKPACDEPHVWEVYRNANSGSYEDEVAVCATLDIALKSVLHHAKEMKAKAGMFEDALNVVCGECLYTCSDDCEKCNVRKTADYLLGR